MGWQIQPVGISIQNVVEEALSTLFQEKITLVGASRTDSGVHALGQVAHFFAQKTIEKRRFLYSINALLPRDIRVIDFEQVDSSFHSQYSAKRKLYYYHLNVEKENSPFSHLYHYHFPFPLTVSKLHDALQIFVGTHDFTSFANMGSSAKTRERTIYRFDLIEETGGYRMECEGNGFLYKMVRNMVGGAIDVARGKMDLDDLKEILDKRDRKLAPPPAPARGLFLIRVEY